MSYTFPSKRIPKRAQTGFTLMLVLLVVILGSIGALFSYARPSQVTIDREQQTTAALARARAALLAHAVADSDGAFRPGDLPCPDTDNDGSANPPCATLIGRLPWRTLGLGDLRDGYGERLWYTLSQSFRNNPKIGTILNSETPGQLTITGDAPAAGIIAIVFAPGPALAGQLRDAASQLNVANYLDEENADGDNLFTTGLASPTFNDRLSAITAESFFAAVTQRVINHARTALKQYFDTYGHFPNANAYSDASENCDPALYQGRIPKVIDPKSGCEAPGVNFDAWFFTNNWHHVLFYAVSPPCTTIANKATCEAAGGLIAPNSPMTRALLIAAGPGLAGQTRPCLSVLDCIEDPENTNGDPVFIKPLPAASNDRLLVVAP